MVSGKSGDRMFIQILGLFVLSCVAMSVRLYIIMMSLSVRIVINRPYRLHLKQIRSLTLVKSPWNLLNQKVAFARSGQCRPIHSKK